MGDEAWIRAANANGVLALSAGVFPGTGTYPGNREDKGDNRKAVASGRAGGGANPDDVVSIGEGRNRVAVEHASGRGPRVASGARQPWAGRRNPVGIRNALVS